jgi:hypothetical protein
VRKLLHDHLDPGVFAPDAVSTLIAAFDGAWQSIIASGARLSGQQSELTRELLAKEPHLDIEPHLATLPERPATPAKANKHGCDGTSGCALQETLQRFSLQR